MGSLTAVSLGFLLDYPILILILYTCRRWSAGVAGDKERRRPFLLRRPSPRGAFSFERFKAIWDRVSGQNRRAVHVSFVRKNRVRAAPPAIGVVYLCFVICVCVLHNMMAVMARNSILPRAFKTHRILSRGPAPPQVFSSLRILARYSIQNRLRDAYF